MFLRVFGLVLFLCFMFGIDIFYQIILSIDHRMCELVNPVLDSKCLL